MILYRSSWKMILHGTVYIHFKGAIGDPILVSLRWQSGF